MKYVITNKFLYLLVAAVSNSPIAVAAALVTMFVAAEVVRPAPVVVDVFTAFLPCGLGTTPIIISYLTMQLPINFHCEK